MDGEEGLARGYVQICFQVPEIANSTPSSARRRRSALSRHSPFRGKYCRRRGGAPYLFAGRKNKVKMGFSENGMKNPPESAQMTITATPKNGGQAQVLTLELVGGSAP